MKKYRVIGNGHPYTHYFKIGSIVTVDNTARDGVSQFSNGTDNLQWIGCEDVKEIIPIFHRLINFIKGWFHK